MNPSDARQIPYVEQLLGEGTYPTIAVSDNQIAVPDMIRQWVGGDYSVLGTDGFGRSDTREKLRQFFEMDQNAIVFNVLKTLNMKKELKEFVKENKIKFSNEAPWKK